MTIRLHNRKTLLGAIMVLLFILGLGHIFNVAAANLLTVAVIIVLALLADVDTLFVIMYTTLPFYNIMNLRAGTYSLHYLILGFFCLRYSARKGIRKTGILCFAILFLLRVFAFDMKLLVSWSMTFLPLVLTYHDQIWNRNMKDITVYASISMILASAIGYVMLLRGASIYTNAYLYYNGIQIVRFAGLSGDSIAYGEMALLLIALNTVVMMESRRYKKWKTMVYVALGIFSLLTYSKSTLLCLVFLLIITLLRAEHRMRNKALRLLFIILITIALSVAAMVVINLIVSGSDNLLISGYVDRFTRNNLSTGRDTVWSHYLSLMNSNLAYLFIPLSNALYSEPFYNPATQSFIWHAHNLYLETICVFGWIGGVMLLFWLISQIVRFLMRHSDQVRLLPLLVLLIMGIGAHGNLEYPFYLQLALALSLLDLSVKVGEYNDFTDEKTISPNTHSWSD